MPAPRNSPGYGVTSMADRLRDKVAIVTGGGDGIGRGVVRRFAAEGAKVLVAEIDDDSGERVAAACRDEFGADVRFLHTDASAKTDVGAMVARRSMICSRISWGNRARSCEAFSWLR